jgi:hypothetical protein
MAGAGAGASTGTGRHQTSVGVLLLMIVIGGWMRMRREEGFVGLRRVSVPPFLCSMFPLLCLLNFSCSFLVLFHLVS